MSDQTADLPSHAYVPGRNARHPDGAFDVVRGTARPGMSEVELQESDAFRAGVLFLEQGFYWEAHEVLEPVWMSCPPNSEARSLVQGIIQLANAELKAVMGRPKASTRLCDIAMDHLAQVSSERVLGLNVEDMRCRIDSLRSRHS